MANSEKHSSLSSDKLLMIIECIAENRQPVRLQDLAEQVGITQSTVLRYLRTLQNCNYVYQDETTLRYALTWKVCRLTENLNSYLSLRNIATPFVNDLANTLHTGICLVTEQSYECVYLDCIDAPNPFQPPLQFIGKRAPMHVTASGKVLLSSFSDQQLEEYISTKGLKPCTKNSIHQKGRLIEELAQIRKQGFATEIEECELGLRCISYPIRCYSGKIYAAISAFGRVGELDDRFLQEYVQPLLKKSSEMISLRLGWDTNANAEQHSLLEESQL